jgi:hypothetical protein
MIHRNLRALALIGFFGLFAAPAYATKDVSSPNVSRGKLKFEARFGLENDDVSASRDDRFRQTYLLEYGMNEWWSTRANLKFTALDGSDNGLTAVEWENKFQLFFEKKDGLSGGFKVVTGVASDMNMPDTIEIKGLLEKNFGDFRARGNLGLLWQVGDDATRQAQLNAALQGMLKLNDTFSAGAEWFGDFGEIENMSAFDQQDHLLGPVINIKINETWSAEAGYLFGISDTASDGLVKVFLKGTF